MQATSGDRFARLPTIPLTTDGTWMTNAKTTPRPCHLRHDRRHRSLGRAHRMRVHDPRFADAVQAVVVGRDIDEVHVDKLAGSSRTPDGFNAALEQIKAEAAK